MQSLVRHCVHAGTLGLISGPTGWFGSSQMNGARVEGRALRMAIPAVVGRNTCVVYFCTYFPIRWILVLVA